MRDVAVYAAVGNKSVKMKRGIVLLCVSAGCQQSLILKEIAVLNLFRNSGKLLVHDAPCAHVQVPYLGISHLSVRQTDRQTARLSLNKRALRHQLVHHRRIRLGDSIAVYSFVQSVTIQNH